MVEGKSRVLRVQKDLVATLAALSGQLATEDTILHEGTRIVLPEGMTHKDALDYIGRDMEAQEQKIEMHRSFNYRPWDGAQSFYRTALRVFGHAMDAQQQANGLAALFGGGDDPSRRIAVSCGYGKTVEVPWGQFSLPGLDGAVFETGNILSDRGNLFNIVVTTPRKYRHAIQGFLNIVEQDMPKQSLYQGKAFDGATQPSFLNLDSLDPQTVVFSDSLRAQLEANVWSLLCYRDECVGAGLPERRCVTFVGPHGVGKTLTALVTAQLAVANGVTFILCRPQDSISGVLQTARLHEPAVVFAEDVDVETEEAGGEKLRELLDTLDGMTTKDSRILTIFTTNYPERIRKGMLRPGRIDAVVEFGGLDLPGIQRMVEVNILPAARGAIDYVRVHEAVQDFAPAFVKEVVDRAKRYSISRNKGQLLPISTEDLLLSAEGLRPQLALMNQAAAKGTHPSVEEMLAEAVADKLRESS